MFFYNPKANLNSHQKILSSASSRLFKEVILNLSFFFLRILILGQGLKFSLVESENAKGLKTLPLLVGSNKVPVSFTVTFQTNDLIASVASCQGSVYACTDYIPAESTSAILIANSYDKRIY